jgi:hypothetical protein
MLLSVPILSNWPVSTIPQVDNTLQRSDRRSNSTRRFLDIVARRVCHDGARNKAKEMIRSWGKCVLADEPPERRHQGEQVVRIHISARRARPGRPPRTARRNARPRNSSRLSARSFVSAENFDCGSPSQRSSISCLVMSWDKFFSPSRPDGGGVVYNDVGPTGSARRTR